MRSRIPRRGLCTLCVCLLAVSRSYAATIAVPAGGDFQAALNAAKPGDVITLAAGATYVGNFVLPNKGDVGEYVTIRSAAPDTSLPPAGVRITPAYASQLPKIKSSNNMSALRTAASANHYRLMFLEFQANVNGYGDIIELGVGDSSQAQLSQVPYALVVDRVYVHGDPMLGQKRGIALHSRDTTIVNSYVADCKAVGQEAQAIAGFNGPGNYLIENNYLEGSTQSFLLGGADPVIQNLVTSNVTFRRNHLSKPLAWRDPIIATPAGVTATVAAGAGSLPAGTYGYKVAARVPAGQTTKANSAASVEVTATVPAGVSGGVTISWTPVVGASDYAVYGRTAGAEDTYWITKTPYFTDTGASGTAGKPVSATKWFVKNIFELKNAQDVLVEGNVFENLWIASQNGFPIVFTPRNQGGTAPWSVVQRVTFQYNLVRHTAGGVNILGVDNLQPSQRTNHVTIQHNVFDDLTASVWGSGSRPFQLGDGPDSVTMDHNTIVTTDSCILWLYGGPAGSPTPMTNIVYTNNVSAHNSYGIDGSNYSPGFTSIAAYLPGSTIAANILAGGSASKYPAGNFFPTVSTWQASFVDYAAGDYHLLASSTYKNAGTDGEDLGANIDVVNAQALIALGGNNPAASAPIRITPTDVPNPLYMTPYSQPLACGAASCGWQVVDSTLPTGLSFDVVHGAISGTPTAIQTGLLTVNAYDTNNTANQASATLTVTVDPPPLQLTIPPAPAGQAGVAYQLMPAVSGALGSTWWTVSSGALPAGLSLNSSTGLISGVPSAWGTSTAVVQVQDSWSPTRTASQPVSIAIAPSPIVIATTTLASGFYQQMYSALLNATGGTGSTVWSLAAGALPSGITLNPSGTISGVPASIGTFTVTVAATDANWPANTSTVTLSLVIAAASFSASIPPAPAGQVGVAYALTAVSTGQIGSVSWTIGSGALPPGITLGAATGVMSGVPTSYGSYTATLVAHDSYDPARTATATTTISVAPSQIVVATASLPDGSVRTAYQATLAATGGTGQTSWSLKSGSLPKGLTLSTNGVISGTPTSVGSSTFTVQATDAAWAGNIATKSLTIVIHAREVVLYATDVTTLAGTWSRVSDSTAAAGVRVWNPNNNAAKITAALATPVNYFEVTFQAEAGVAYHLWVRGRADNNYWGNDSVFVQFSNSVDANGNPIYRIGTTGGGAVNLEDCSGCGESGWGWQDNGYGAGVMGPNIYFAASGAQTLRVQVREDGFSIDQIVLSAVKYLTAAPGTLENDATILPR